MAFYDDPYYNYEYDQTYADQGYGIDQYYDQSSPPPPADPNWVAPVPVVKKYLRRIQKDCIQEEFEDLKELGIYLLEIEIESLELRNDEALLLKEEEKLSVQVKLFNLDFSDIKEEDLVEQLSSSGTCNSEKNPDITDFLQAIYAETKYNRNLKDVSYIKQAKMMYIGESEIIDEPVETKEAPTDFVTFKINRGKGIMLAMTGLQMIQHLQQYPVRVRVRVMQSDTPDTAKAELESSFRVPDALPQTVLTASRSNTILPELIMSSGQFTVLDQNGSEVGELKVTLTLTCLGNAVVNCLHEDSSMNYNFEHTDTLRTQHRTDVQDIPGYEETTFTPFPTEYCLSTLPTFKTSKEILHDCIKTNKLEVSPEERSRLLNSCNWFQMARDIIPEEQHTLDSDHDNDWQYRWNRMWRANMRLCRDIMEQKDKRRRPSVLERLDSLLLQDGVNLENKNSPLSHVSTTDSIKSIKSLRISNGSSTKDISI